MLYCNYKKVFQCRKLWLFITECIRNFLKSSLPTNKKCHKKYKKFLILSLCKFSPEI